MLGVSDIWQSFVKKKKKMKWKVKSKVLAAVSQLATNIQNSYVEIKCWNAMLYDYSFISSSRRLLEINE